MIIIMMMMIIIIIIVIIIIIIIIISSSSSSSIIIINVWKLWRQMRTGNTTKTAWHAYSSCYGAPPGSPFGDPLWRGQKTLSSDAIATRSQIIYLHKYIS